MQFFFRNWQHRRNRNGCHNCCARACNQMSSTINVKLACFALVSGRLLFKSECERICFGATLKSTDFVLHAVLYSLRMLLSATGTFMRNWLTVLIKHGPNNAISSEGIHNRCEIPVSVEVHFFFRSVSTREK